MSVYKRGFYFTRYFKGARILKHNNGGDAITAIKRRFLIMGGI